MTAPRRAVLRESQRYQVNQAAPVKAATERLSRASHTSQRKRLVDKRLSAMPFTAPEHSPPSTPKTKRKRLPNKGGGRVYSESALRPRVCSTRRPCLPHSFSLQRCSAHSRSRHPTSSHSTDCRPAK